MKKSMIEVAYQVLTNNNGYMHFVDLWKVFFKSIGIEQRKNPRCQRNMLPLWYRKHMTEFH